MLSELQNYLALITACGIIIVVVAVAAVAVAIVSK